MPSRHELTQDMKNNQEYKSAALDALKGGWPEAVVTAIVYFAVAAVCTAPSALQGIGLGHVLLSPVLFLAAGGSTLILSLLFLAPLQVGYYNAFKRLHQEGDAGLVGNLFSQGFRNWGHIVLGQFLMGVFIFLWSLLLVVPGIVKAYSYAMTPYILVDRPELSANEAISLSSKMMAGRKFDLFRLQLSFVGWLLLCVLTLGTGALFLSPYMMTAQAAFYQDVRADYEIKSARF